MFSSIHCKKCLRFALRQKNRSSAGLNQEASALLPAISKNFATAWACRMLPRESATIKGSSTDGDWPTSQHMVGEGFQLKMLEVKKQKINWKLQLLFSVQFILFFYDWPRWDQYLPCLMIKQLEVSKAENIWTLTYHIQLDMIHSFIHHHQEQQ